MHNLQYTHTQTYYFPKTSPTTLAHFRYELLEDNPNPFIAYNIRLCTGFIPSRASGNARPKMILNEYCMKELETSSGKSMTFFRVAVVVVVVEEDNNNSLACKAI